jgi:hypothetical protein
MSDAFDRIQTELRRQDDALHALREALEDLGEGSASAVEIPHAFLAELEELCEPIASAALLPPPRPLGIRA